MQRRVAASDDEEESVHEIAEDNASVFSVSDDEDDVSAVAAGMQEVGLKEQALPAASGQSPSTASGSGPHGTPAAPATDLAARPVQSSDAEQNSAPADKKSPTSEQAAIADVGVVVPQPDASATNNTAVSAEVAAVGQSEDAAAQDGSGGSNNLSEGTASEGSGEGSHLESASNAGSATSSAEHEDEANASSEQVAGEDVGSSDSELDEGSDSEDRSGTEEQHASRPPGRVQGRKPLEPYEVPTAGAFFMHDDRFGGEDGKAARPIRRTKPEWSPADDRWSHDKFDSLSMPPTAEEEPSMRSRRGTRGRGGRGRGRGDIFPSDSHEGFAHDHSQQQHQGRGRGRGNRRNNNPGRGRGYRGGPHPAEAMTAVDGTAFQPQSGGRQLSSSANHTGAARGNSGYGQERQGQSIGQARLQFRTSQQDQSPAHPDDDGDHSGAFRAASSGLRAEAQDYTPSPSPVPLAARNRPAHAQVQQQYYSLQQYPQRQAQNTQQQQQEQQQQQQQQSQGHQSQERGIMPAGAAGGPLEDASSLEPPPQPRYIPQLPYEYPLRAVSAEAAGVPPLPSDYSRWNGYRNHQQTDAQQQQQQQSGVSAEATYDSTRADSSIPASAQYSYAAPSHSAASQFGQQYSQKYDSSSGYGGYSLDRMTANFPQSSISNYSSMGVYAPPPAGFPQQQLARPVPRPIPIQAPPEAPDQGSYDAAAPGEAPRIGGRRYSTMAAVDQ